MCVHLFVIFACDMCLILHHYYIALFFSLWKCVCWLLPTHLFLTISNANVDEWPVIYHAMYTSYTIHVRFVAYGIELITYEADKFLLFACISSLHSTLWTWPLQLDENTVQREKRNEEKKNKNIIYVIHLGWIKWTIWGFYELLFKSLHKHYDRIYISSLRLFIGQCVKVERSTYIFRGMDVQYRGKKGISEWVIFSDSFFQCALAPMLYKITKLISIKPPTIPFQTHIINYTHIWKVQMVNIHIAYGVPWNIFFYMEIWQSICRIK